MTDTTIASPEKNTAQPMATKTEFPVWMTLLIGCYPFTLTELVDDIRLYHNLDEILRGITLSEKEEEIDLVMVSGEILGLCSRDGNTRIKHLYDRVRELGFSICPAEVGLRLRRKYGHQPVNDWVHIGMETIFTSKKVFGPQHPGIPHVFVVAHSEGMERTLTECEGSSPDSYVPGYQKWVFVKPRK